MRKKIVSEKFGYEKILGLKKIWAEKNFSPKIHWFPKDFWSEMFFLGLKKLSQPVNPKACSFDNGKYSGWGQLSPGQMLNAPMSLLQFSHALIFVCQISYS